MASSRKSLFMEGTRKRLNSPKPVKTPGAGAKKVEPSPAKIKGTSVKKLKPKVKADKEKVAEEPPDVATSEQQVTGIDASEKSLSTAEHAEKPMEIDNTTPDTSVSTDRVSPKDVNLEIKEPEKHFDVQNQRERSDSDEPFRPIIFRLGSETSEKEDEDEVLMSAEDEEKRDHPGILAVPQFRKGSTSTPIRFSVSDDSTSAKDTTMSSSKTLRKHNLTDELEDMSLSSSGFSPCSTSASFKSFDGRNRIDDFSDDSDCPKMRESIDLSDDAEVASLTKPLNQQLRVLTSLSPANQPLSPNRRSSSPINVEARTGGELIRRLSDHLMFVDYLRKRDLSSCVSHFPSDMTITNFR